MKEKMKKIIKKIGTSAGLIFNKEEMLILKAEVGDLAEFDDPKITKQKKKKQIK